MGIVLVDIAESGIFSCFRRQIKNHMETVIKLKHPTDIPYISLKLNAHQLYDGRRTGEYPTYRGMLDPTLPIGDQRFMFYPIMYDRAM
jgi:hypothetical protein